MSIAWQPQFQMVIPVVEPTWQTVSDEEFIEEPRRRYAPEEVSLIACCPVEDCWYPIYCLSTGLDDPLAGKIVGLTLEELLREHITSECPIVWHNCECCGYAFIIDFGHAIEVTKKLATAEPWKWDI